MKEGTDHPATAMNEIRLAEIKALLAEPPPISAISKGNAEKSPVAAYLTRLRSDQIDLVREIERLQALVETQTGSFESSRDRDKSVESAALCGVFEI